MHTLMPLPDLTAPDVEQAAASGDRIDQQLADLALDSVSTRAEAAATSTINPASAQQATMRRPRIHVG